MNDRDRKAFYIVFVAIMNALVILLIHFIGKNDPFVQSWAVKLKESMIALDEWAGMDGDR